NQVSSRYPSHVDRGELWNAGALGLVEAAARFREEAGVPFPRYAATRIKGAIIDSTRQRDWAGRAIRRNTREIRRAEEALTDAQGRLPSDPALAAALPGLAARPHHHRQAAPCPPQRRCSRVPAAPRLPGRRRGPARGGRGREPPRLPPGGVAAEPRAVRHAPRGGCRPARAPARGRRALLLLCRAAAGHRRVPRAPRGPAVAAL